MDRRRRMKGEGGCYQRPDGLWCAQIDVGYAAGKRKRRTVYGKTQAEAVRKLNQARRDIDAGRTATANRTVASWLREWLYDIAAGNVKPGTFDFYRGYVENHLIPVLGRVRLDRLEPRHVRDMHKTVRAAASSTTALHAHRTLSTALERACREGVVTRNVASLVDAPARAASGRTGLTGPQARQVLETAGDDDMASRWWMAFLSGARQGECLGLRWPYLDIDDLEAATADISWSLQRVRYRHGCTGTRPAPGKPWPCGHRWGSGCPQRHVEVPDGYEHERLDGNLCLLRPKTEGSRRLVPLLPAMAAALRVQRDRDTGPNPHRLVWHRPDGRPVAPHDDWTAWGALLTAADVPKVTLHEARNTTATLLLEAGVDAKVIASIIGHSNVVTTRRYQTVSLELGRRAVGQLGTTLGLPAGE